MSINFNLKQISNWISYFFEKESFRNVEEKFNVRKEIIHEFISQFRKNPIKFFIALAYQDISLLKNPIEIKLLELLMIEKKRRNLKANKLVFLGMANLANYYWCAMKSYYKSKEGEEMFFGAYLVDRIMYALQLDYIKKIPKNPIELLEIGSQISLKDIEKILHKRNVVEKNINIITTHNIIVENGVEKIVVNPNLDENEKKFIIEEAKSNNIEIIDAEKHPLILGEMVETTKAEKYSTIRWNFEWKDFVLVGVPDGIANEFVYEFKTTGSEFLSHYVKPVASTQADLYGFFFNRNNKRVQIYLRDSGLTKTWEEEINKENVNDLLLKFEKIDRELPIAPKKWKCKSCEFFEICQISPLKNI